MIRGSGEGDESHAHKLPSPYLKTVSKRKASVVSLQHSSTSPSCCRLDVDFENTRTAFDSNRSSLGRIQHLAMQLAVLISYTILLCSLCRPEGSNKLDIFYSVITLTLSSIGWNVLGLAATPGGPVGTPKGIIAVLFQRKKVNEITGQCVITDLPSRR